MTVQVDKEWLEWFRGRDCQIHKSVKSRVATLPTLYLWEACLLLNLLQGRFTKIKNLSRET